MCVARHSGGINMAYTDGHAKWVRAQATTTVTDTTGLGSVKFFPKTAD